MAERKEKRTTLGRASSKKTTKKVAANKVSKKTTKKVTKETTRAVSKATTSKVKKAPGTTKKTKTTATKKASVKKTAKKVAKKTTKKVAKEGRVKSEISESPTKPKEVKIISKKSTNKKAEVKTSRRAKPADDVSISTTHHGHKTRSGITIFSRVKTDNAVLLVARTFGFVFITLGLLFTAIGLGRTQDTGYLASTVSSFDRLLIANTITGTLSTTTTSVTNVAPIVRYDFPSGDLSGEVKLLLNVEAERVKVFIENTDDSFSDYADTTDYLNWRLPVDTTGLLDGTYNVRTLIITKNGEYWDDAPAITIENVRSIDGTTDGTDITDTPTTNTATGLDYTNLEFSYIDRVPQLLEKETRVTFTAKHVVSAKAIVRHTETGDTKRISVNQLTTDTWAYKLVPDDFAYGLHKIAVQMNASDDQVFTSFTREFTVEAPANSTDDTTDDTEFIDNETDESEKELADNVAEETTTITEKVTESTADQVKPPTKLLITATRPLAGKVPVIIEIDGTARGVELYAERVGSNQPKYVGSAYWVETGRWRVIWDTTNLPNAKYEVVAKVTNAYGSYLTDRVSVAIYNEVVTNTTDAQTTIVKEVQSLVETEDKTEATANTTTASTGDANASIINTDTQSPADDEREVDVAVTAEQTREERIREQVSELIDESRAELNDTIRKYAEAIRAGDTETAAEALDEFEHIKDALMQKYGQYEAVADLLTEVEVKLDEKIATLKANVERSEQIIKDRTAESVRRDSDSDGISDYDEITLYETDPFSADTDGDGFDDGSEIIGGYNPKNAAPEAAIEYESPKDVGVVREDILSVDSIVTEPEPVAGTSDDGATPRASALISGHALPNSFVTLYIFSTPVVVTVKTDDDGSWSYRFEKELEDGEHEVYVGITDNSGKIVAKSNPLTFVKEAQAFTAVDAEAASATISSTDAAPSLVDNNALVIALASLLTSLGFLLLLISLFVKKREQGDSPLIGVTPEAHVA